MILHDLNEQFEWTILFRPMFDFYTPCKRQKTKGFLIFSEGIEAKHWHEKGRSKTDSDKFDFQLFWRYVNIIVNNIHGNWIDRIILVFCQNHKRAIDRAKNSRTKNELEMFVMSCTKFWSNIILILLRIVKKQSKVQLLLSNNAYDDVMDFEGSGFSKNPISKYLENKTMLLHQTES